MKSSFIVVSMACIFITTKSKAQNVGVGTTMPLSKLHVYSGASGATPYAPSHLVVESNSHTYINMLSPLANETAIFFGLPAGSTNGGIVYNNASTPNGFQFRTNGNLTRMTVINNGNVGINNLLPSEKLEVTGNVKANSFVYTTPKTSYYSLSGVDFTGERSIDTTVINVGSGGIAMQNTIAGKKVIAPVHLPQGATMINMTVYFYDASASQNLQAVFNRKTILSNFFSQQHWCCEFLRISGCNNCIHYRCKQF